MLDSGTMVKEMSDDILDDRWSLRRHSGSNMSS